MVIMLQLAHVKNINHVMCLGTEAGGVLLCYTSPSTALCITYTIFMPLLLLAAITKRLYLSLI